MSEKLVFFQDVLQRLTKLKCWYIFGSCILNWTCRSLIISLNSDMLSSQKILSNHQRFSCIFGIPNWTGLIKLIYFWDSKIQEIIKEMILWSKTQFTLCWVESLKLSVSTNDIIADFTFCIQLPFGEIIHFLVGLQSLTVRLVIIIQCSFWMFSILINVKINKAARSYISQLTKFICSLHHMRPFIQYSTRNPLAHEEFTVQRTSHYNRLLPVLFCVWGRKIKILLCSFST